MICLRVVAHARRDGTIDVFVARDDDGCELLIAVEPRSAAALMDQLQAATSVPVQVEPWQVIGGYYPAPAA